MDTVWLFAIQFAGFLTALLFTKCSSRAYQTGGKAGQVLNSLIGSVIGMAFFFALGGFSVQMNTRTLIYAALFAVEVCVSQALNLVIYRYVGMAALSVAGNTITLLASVFFGTLLFAEELGPIVLLRIGLMIAATVLIAYKPRAARETEKTGKFSLVSILLIVLYAACSIGSLLINRYFSRDPDVTDKNSFLFMTNVFLFGLVIVRLFFLLLKDRRQVFSEISGIPPRAYFYTAGTLLVGDAQTWFVLLLYAAVDISIVTPVNTALSLIAAVLVGFFFREKLRLSGWIALALSIAAVFI